MKKKENRGLIVAGKTYVNSAAKFWLWFLRESRTEFSGAVAFEMSAPGTGVLDRRILFPEETLAAEWERLDAAAARQEYVATVQELDLLGPPAGVRLRVMGEVGVLANRAVEAIDAETFPYLVGWLLEWGTLEAMLWSQAFVSGGFEAESVDGGECLEIAFDLVTAELGEGMVMRTITIR